MFPKIANSASDAVREPALPLKTRKSTGGLLEASVNTMPAALHKSCPEGHPQEEDLKIPSFLWVFIGLFFFFFFQTVLPRAGHEGCPVLPASNFVPTPAPRVRFPEVRVCLGFDFAAQPFPTARMELELPHF